VSWVRRAAAQARERRAFAEALRLCRIAVHHVPPGDDELQTEVLTELGLAQLEVGDPGGEQSLLEAALKARHHGCLDIAAQASLGLTDLARDQTRLRTDVAAVVDDILAAAELIDEQTERESGERALDELARARLVARRVELGGAQAGRWTSAAARSATDVLSRELGALAGPDDLKRRSVLADELALVGTAVRHARSHLIGAHHQAMVAATTGDQPTIEEALRSMSRAVGAEGHPLLDALLAERAVAQAVAQGRLTEAAATVATLADTPQDDPDPPVLGDGDITAVRETCGLDTLAPGDAVHRQMVVARWLQGTLGHEPSPGSPSDADAATGALVALAQGDRGRAHLTVRLLATGAEPLPAGDEWLHAVGLLSLVAAELGEPATATPLIGLLAPHRDLVCGIGYRSFVATTNFHLGRLAAVVGDWADAERDLLAALRQLTALGARPWVALTQHSLANVLEARGSSSDREWVGALRAEARWTAMRLGLRTLA
jgi:hypothetical protein